jgi:UDP-N-acetylmuramoylalanine-D-glutamate ligase
VDRRLAASRPTLDRHPTLEAYRSAKARIFAHRPGRLGRANADDPAVAEWGDGGAPLSSARGRLADGVVVDGD